jgi:tetratricopeptide (TPR) repeat protein
MQRASLHAAAAGAATAGDSAVALQHPPAGAADEKALLRDALDSGSDDEVLQQLTVLQQRFPANAHFVIAAAGVTARRHDAATARHLFQRAVQIAAGNQREVSMALQSWGVFESRQGRHQEAMQLLQQAADADPSHAAAHSALGRCAEAAGQLPAAAAHYRAAVAAEPKHAPSLQALALVEAKLGRMSRARQLFEKAVAAAPGNPQLYQAWALMEWRQGRYSAAKRLFLEGATECLPHAPLLAAHAK